MPTNTYICLSRQCKHEFEASVQNPFCPQCGGRPCKWLPQRLNYTTGKVKRAESTIAMLVSEHNARAPAHEKIGDVRPEVGMPTIRPAPPQRPQGPTMQHTFQTPVGPCKVNVPIGNDGNAMVTSQYVPELNQRQKFQIGGKGNDSRQASGVTKVLNQ